MGIKSIWHNIFSSDPEIGPLPVVNSDCAEFEVNNWQISDFVVNVLVPNVGTTPFPLNELMLMTAAVCRVQPTHIFEWGTHIGKSARVFHETCKAFGIATEIHSIDLPDDAVHVEHPGEARGSLVKDVPEVQLLTGDGLNTALKVIAEKADSVVRPFFFVDGDHSFDSVTRELEGILQEVPHATILAHDTFLQSEQSGYNIGPYQAIQMFLQNHPGKFRVLSQSLGLPGMTLLWQTKRKSTEL